MIVSAIVIILVVLWASVVIYGAQVDGIGNATFLLVGGLLGVALAALATTCVVFLYKRNKNAAIQRHGYKFLIPDEDNPRPTPNNIVKNQETAVSPCVLCSCRTEPHTHQEKSITAVTDHTELHNYSDMDRQQHKQVSETYPRRSVATKTTLDIIPEAPATVAQDHCDNLDLEPDAKSKSPSQLESYC